MSPSKSITNADLPIIIPYLQAPWKWLVGPYRMQLGGVVCGQHPVEPLSSFLAAFKTYCRFQL